VDSGIISGVKSANQTARKNIQSYVKSPAAIARAMRLCAAASSRQNCDPMRMNDDHSVAMLPLACVTSGASIHGETGLVSNVVGLPDIVQRNRNNSLRSNSRLRC
jgi:hypothetical protein